MSALVDAETYFRSDQNLAPEEGEALIRFMREGYALASLATREANRAAVAEARVAKLEAANARMREALYSARDACSSERRYREVDIIDAALADAEPEVQR